MHKIRRFFAENPITHGASVGATAKRLLLRSDEFWESMMQKFRAYGAWPHPLYDRGFRRCRVLLSQWYDSAFNSLRADLTTIRFKAWAKLAKMDAAKVPADDPARKQVEAEVAAARKAEAELEKDVEGPRKRAEKLERAGE